MAPIISVILPAYNCDEFIGSSIESILNQSIEDIELIISVDESTDATEEIIEHYQRLDPRVKVFSGKKRGLIQSLNDALKMSSGKYIARMDADDISLPNRFAIQIKYFEQFSDIGVIGSWMDIIDRYGKSINSWETPTDDESLKSCLIFSVPFGHPTVMFRRKLITDYKIEYDSNYETVEDYKLWLDLAEHTKFYVVPQKLLKYRLLENSLSNTADKNFTERFSAMLKPFRIMFNKLSLVNNPDEDYLHYLLSSNSRLSDYPINARDLNCYLQKLIHHNDQVQLLQPKAFNSLLSKKFLVTFYFSIKKFRITSFQFLTYKFLWVGLVHYVFGKLRWYT